MSKNIAVNIKTISKSFGDKVIFDNFNLKIYKGDIHAIIGPNGSGKTSLLRCITSLYNLDNGEIKVNGSHSMLLENDYLYENMTGMENLKLFGKYFGYKVDDSFKNYSDQLDLTVHLDKKVSEYSKGMKRKLSLLIIILIDADIILLDEPTSGVDPISRVEIRKLISEMKDDNKTIIITSHDLNEIEKIASSITMIKDGKIVFNEGIDAFKDISLEEVFIRRGNDEE